MHEESWVYQTFAYFCAGICHGDKHGTHIWDTKGQRGGECSCNCRMNACGRDCPYGTDGKRKAKRGAACGYGSFRRQKDTDRSQ